VRQYNNNFGRLRNNYLLMHHQIQNLILSYGKITTHFMKTAIKIVFSGMLLILTGCVTLYKPNAIHSPMLKEKGELNTSASLGLSGCGLYNLQAAYAKSEHVGIMADVMYHNRHTSSTDSSVTTVEKLNMFSGEAGAGYFTTFGIGKNGLFQCYGGGGYGFTTDRIYNANQPKPELSAQYYNIFIQPGVAFTSKYFDAAFDLRANYVCLFNIHAYLYNKFEWWNTDFKFYNDTTVYFMNLEPAITLKAGGEKWKGIFQFGVTIPTINSDTYFSVNTSSMFGTPLIKFSVGVNYTIGKK
jgi:hypothetical protein